ncbi:hypothetical protein CLU79DRAFT_834033 [Phycomyces nitens]|nr:hypothetical protein CLU79DRAFT_834033 [Phycomyces nitens]
MIPRTLILLRTRLPLLSQRALPILNRRLYGLNSGHDNADNTSYSFSKDDGHNPENPIRQEFKVLLDSLFEETPDDEPPKPMEPLTKAGTLIEKRLLEMVLKKKKPYKENTPLPRGVMGYFYGKKANEELVNQSFNISQTGFPEITNYDEFDSMWIGKSSTEFLEQVSSQINESTYGPKYANVIESALGHAAFNLRDPYLAITIFEQVKSQSIESYVSGCTVDVYNQMLNIRWQLLRDVHGILGLAEEMNVNGVGYNAGTRELVQAITKEVLGDMRLKEQEYQEGSLWSADEKRATNLMKALVAKWLLR